MGFLTLGSPYARKKQAEAAEAQTQLARQEAQIGAAQEGRANEMFGQWQRYVPQALGRLNDAYTQSPQYFDRMRGIQNRDVQENSRRAYGSALNTLGANGVMNSSLLASTMAGIGGQTARATYENDTNLMQAEDERKLRILQYLMQGAEGAGAGGMAGAQGAASILGQAGQGYASAGQTWGDVNAQAMAPFNAFMGLAGTVGGAALGGGFGRRGSGYTPQGAPQLPNWGSMRQPAAPLSAPQNFYSYRDRP